MGPRTISIFRPGQERDEFVIEPADHTSALEQERFAARDTLRGVLGVLSVRDREIIHASFYEDLSREDAAERFGMTPQGISAVLVRSMARMHKALDATKPPGSPGAPR